MKHPLATWPPTRRRQWFYALLAATGLVYVVLGSLNVALMTGEAPRGILSLQFTNNPSRAADIVASWARTNALDAAGFILGFDYVLMPLYSTVLAVLCIVVSKRAAGRGQVLLARIGPPLAWAAWAAGACDAVENAAHFAFMRPAWESPDRYLTVAFYAAVTKWALIGACVAYTFAAAAIRQNEPPLEPVA